MSTNRPGSKSPEERRSDVLSALARQGGEASPSEIAEATGIPARTLTRDLDALARLGMVGGDKHRRRLTPEGYEATGPSGHRAPAGTFDGAVREVFPSYLAAFVRLIADAVVIRSLRPDRSWHPSFAACGSPATGKSAMAAFVCWAFGLDGQDCVRMAPSLAPGELLGRRHQVPGGTFVIDPSSLASVPFVCLDEWGQADEKVRRESLRLLDGLPRVTVEDVPVDLRATAMVAYNPSKASDPRAPLPEPYWRRCLVIHTDAAGPATRSLPEKLRQFSTMPQPAAYDLDAFVLPYDRLPASCEHLLVDGDRGMLRLLTDAGRLHYGDTRSLEALALGRIARHGLTEADDPVAVLLAVAYDVLAVAETIPGHVVGGWRSPIENVARQIERDHGAAPSIPDLRSAITAGDVERAALDAHRADVRQVKERHSLSLTGERAEAMARFDTAARAIQNVPAADRPTAAGLRAQLRKLSKDAGESRSPDALVDVGQLGARVLAEAGALRRRLDADKARAAAERSQQLANAQAQRAAQAIANRARKDQVRALARSEKDQTAKRKAMANEVGRLLRRTTTKPGEDVAGRLVAIGVVRPLEEPYQADARTPWEVLWRKPERLVTRFRRIYEGLDRQRYRSADLASWQAPAVRRLLRSVLAALSESPALGPGQPRSALSPEIMAALPPGRLPPEAW